MALARMHGASGRLRATRARVAPGPAFAHLRLIHPARNRLPRDFIS